MLIGGAGPNGSFVPNSIMIDNLAFSIDVQQAEASDPADRERILEQIAAREGGPGAIDRLVGGMAAFHEGPGRGLRVLAAHRHAEVRGAQSHQPGARLQDTGEGGDITT